MELRFISRADLLDFVGSLIGGKAKVIGAIAKGGQFAFEELDRKDDLRLDYDQTVLPPKKFFAPVNEKLLSFKTGDAGSYAAEWDCQERIIFGIHPGDLAAIALLDKAFFEGENDAHYQSRRKASILVGLYPTRTFTYRFTSSMIKESEAYLASDAMLVDMGDGRYAVELVTEKGRALFDRSKAAPAGKDIEIRIAQQKTAVADQVQMPMEREAVARFLIGKEDHPEWAARAEKCLSCGSCVLVCPTCYCFDVRDEVDLSLKEGGRYRAWDGCTLEGFAMAAGGHNFRKKAADRIRHRIFRKQKFLLDRFGLSGCVGCGRCSRACTAEIASPVDTVNALNGRSK